MYSNIDSPRVDDVYAIETKFDGLGYAVACSAGGEFGRAVERLGKAINDEHAKRREGEDWSLAKDDVRSVLHGMT
jgi:hypothetical protein